MAGMGTHTSAWTSPRTTTAAGHLTVRLMSRKDAAPLLSQASAKQDNPSAWWPLGQQQDLPLTRFLNEPLPEPKELMLTRDWSSYGSTLSSSSKGSAWPPATSVCDFDTSGAACAQGWGVAGDKRRRLAPGMLAHCLRPSAAALQRSTSGEISAHHAAHPLPALACEATWPSLGCATLPARSPPKGCWAPRSRQQAPTPTKGMMAAEGRYRASTACQADAEDVLPCTAIIIRAPCGAYLPPARRPGASTAILAGTCLVRPAIPVGQLVSLLPPPPPPPYKLPQHRTPAEQAAAAEAGRPGRPCAFPAMTAGPLPLSVIAVQPPRYRLALQGLLPVAQPSPCAAAATPIAALTPELNTTTAATATPAASTSAPKKRRRSQPAGRSLAAVLACLRSNPQQRTAKQQRVRGCGLAPSAPSAQPPKHSRRPCSAQLPRYACQQPRSRACC